MEEIGDDMEEEGVEAVVDTEDQEEVMVEVVEVVEEMEEGGCKEQSQMDCSFT